MSDSQKTTSSASASGASPAPAPAATPAAALPPTLKKISPSLRSVLIMAVVALAGILLVLRAWNLFPLTARW